ISGDQATVNLTFANGDKDTLYFKKENGNWLMYGNQQKYEINLSSHHFQDGYYVNVWIDDENEKIQSATISGPGITGSLGLTKQGSGWSLTQSAFISSTQPAGDQIYTIQITDKNGVTDTYQKKITGYVEQFATNLSPTGTVLNQITFSWTGITGAKRYHIELMKNDYSRIWNKYDIAPTLNNTYSVNYDGPPLEQGTYRYFIVSVVETDGMDNFSFAEGQFTYVVQTPYSISGYVKLSDNTTPVSGATVKARNYTTLQIVSEVQTNEQGYFKLPISTTGEYEITVEKAGYEIITPPSTPYLITEDVPDIVLEFPILLQAVGTEAGIIILNRGWNFVSFPKTPPQGSTIEQIMAQKDIRIIWSYNNQTKQWLRWKPAGENNTLTNIEAGKGYWIYANSQQEINISDWATPTSTQVTLYDGWNLVGWMGENGKALSEALASVNWVIVWGWENGTWSAKHYQLQNLPYPPVENFYQGKAYWIKVNTGSTGTTWQQGML
ncbi:MAG: carboxypeptidase-like regulatory domain-containing protein, partial [Thermoplasmatales archaeon]